MKKARLPDQLNICITAQRFPILGRATDHSFLWPIAKGLASRGHKVTVLSSKSPMAKAEVSRDGVNVFYLNDGFPNYSAMNFTDAVFDKFSQLHKETPFHLVHSMDRSALRVATEKRSLDVKVAFDVEATQMAQIFSILGMGQESVTSLLATGFAVAYKFLSTFFGSDRELLKSADGVFVTSPQQRIFLERYYLYPDFHTYTVPYGMELGDLSPRPEALELRQRWSLPETSHIVLTLSDMTEVSNIRNLLLAFERVAVKKPNAYMVIVGNGPKWREIEFEVLSLALGSRVLMTGAIAAEELSDWLSLTEVYVNLSSRTTGFEPSMIEAMAQKKLVIGSEVSPIANIVEDGKDGFLLRPADWESLAHLLIEIFSAGLPVAEIGLRAQEKVLSIFDSRKMVQSIEDAYRKILSRS